MLDRIPLLCRRGRCWGVTSFETRVGRQQGAIRHSPHDPTGAAVQADGPLLVGDDANGVIYRVSYAEAENATGNNTTTG